MHYFCRSTVMVVEQIIWLSEVRRYWLCEEISEFLR